MEKTVHPANRLALDYVKEAAAFAPPERPIIDMHLHLSGSRAVGVFQKAANLYGVSRFYSMTSLEELPEIQSLLGDCVRFVAVPQFRGGDPLHSHGKGYMERLKAFYKLGVRIAKFWSAPRIFDFIAEPFQTHPLRLTSPLRLETMKLASDLGMIFMTHIGDPDTWFQTKYASETSYGPKKAHYDMLEQILEEFKRPTIAAHMGGWPEDLVFLSSLLEKHSNLYLDSSATKWMVRELSKHPRAEVQSFFTRWAGRILFGSDIVTADAHLEPSPNADVISSKASSEREAFDLYASRYWALRKLYESSYQGESPIADPDLSMIDPGRYNEFDAPVLRGAQLNESALNQLYWGTAERLLEPLYT